MRRLANPAMMIEIEADAYAGTANSQTAIAKPKASVKPKPAAKPALEIRKEAGIEETFAPQVVSES